MPVRFGMLGGEPCTTPPCTGPRVPSIDFYAEEKHGADFVTTRPRPTVIRYGREYLRFRFYGAREDTESYQHDLQNFDFNFSAYDSRISEDVSAGIIARTQAPSCTSASRPPNDLRGIHMLREMHYTNYEGNAIPLPPESLQRNGHGIKIIGEVQSGGTCNYDCSPGSLCAIQGSAWYDLIFWIDREIDTVQWVGGFDSTRVSEDSQATLRGWLTLDWPREAPEGEREVPDTPITLTILPLSGPAEPTTLDVTTSLDPSGRFTFRLPVLPAGDYRVTLKVAGNYTDCTTGDWGTCPTTYTPMWRERQFIVGTFTVGGDPSPDRDCRDFGCPTGYTCREVSGQFVCVQDSQQPVDCRDGACPEGFSCVEVNGQHFCVQDSHEHPTPTCDNVRCPRMGCRCFMDNGIPVCYCPGEGEVVPPSCANVRCAPGYTCRTVDGSPHCVTSSPWASCEEANCRYGCMVIDGHPMCYEPPTPDCSRVRCPEGYTCRVNADGSYVCEGAAPPPTPPAGTPWGLILGLAALAAGAMFLSNR